MSMTIISCPKCDTNLLGDTVQCPACRHVLLPDLYEQMKQALEAEQRAAAAESPCPACGEGVRPGLVRCFNCGTYLTSDLAESAARGFALAATAGAGTVQPQYDTGTARPDEIGLAPEDPPRARDDDEETAIAEDDDFEISPAYALRAPAEDLGTYSLAWGGESNEPAPEPVPTIPAPVPQATRAVARPAAAAPVAEAPAEPEPTPATPASALAAPAEIPHLDETSHSVATAGDVLLKIALDEEQQTSERRAALRGGRTPAKRKSGKSPTPRSKAGVIVYCPNGHRVEAQSKHRGLMGRCPKCKMPFFVPNLDLASAPAEGAPPAEAEASEATTPAATATKATPAAAASSMVGGVRWFADLSLHAVNPTKVKAKPGCLAKSFQKVDVAIRPEGILVVTLVKPGGLFGLGAKKPEPVRDAVKAHLAEGKPLTELPAASQQEYATAGLSTLAVIQPAAYAHESPFGDVLVFGEGRIAVKLPDVGEAAEKQFLSFSLSQFREFVSAVRSACGLSSFAETAGVPLTDSNTEMVCHYSESKLQTLNDTGYYSADPAYKLEVIGRKCAECGLVVSEDARKKEKIGGLDGKGIAKAKCPKCQKKFGSISLYRLA